MNRDEQQLIERLAAEVLARLAQQGVSAPGDALAGVAAEQVRAAVKPPIGVCTGDYSKFAELSGQSVGASPSGGQTAHPSDASVASYGPPPLTGFVTEAQLQAAISASPDRVALLAPEAKLTPLANDFVRENPGVIRRVALNVQSGGGHHAPGGAQPALPWMWWLDGPCNRVNQIVAQRGSRMVGAATARMEGGLAAAINELASAIRGGRAAGGVLFVKHGARAICMANRCRAIRAVFGGSDQAVQEGIDTIGANTLVIDYPQTGERAMAMMVDQILQTRPTPPTGLESDLSAMETC